MMTTWYMSTEWHMTIIIAPVLICILKRNEKLGVNVIGSLIAASVIGAGVWTFSRREVAADYVM
jgi:peptidoglycan/LPS O-acetylase OafA/YrhL